MGLVDKVRGGGQIFFIRLKFSFLLKDQFKNKFFWNDFEQQQKWPGSGLPGQPATGAGGFPLLHLLWTFLCLQSATVHWKSVQGIFSVYCTMYERKNVWHSCKDWSQQNQLNHNQVNLGHNASICDNLEDFPDVQIETQKLVAGVQVGKRKRKNIVVCP